MTSRRRCWPSRSRRQGRPTGRSRTRRAAAAAPSPAAPPSAAASAAPPAAGAADVPGVHAGPSVRRMARELGVDLAKVKGTGREGPDHQGRRHGLPARTYPGSGAGRRGTRGGAGIPEIPAQDFSKFGPIETKPLARIKRLSGPFLHRSWLNVPHVTHNDEADITDLDRPTARSSTPRPRRRATG